MGDIGIVYDENVSEYPNEKDFFSPSVSYPEYKYGSKYISHNKNVIYDMLRTSFIELNYDKTHYGTPEWNPLGKFIKHGDTVLIKPNWVENKNKNKDIDDRLSCLVTHPAVVRAIIDYVVIALKNSGKIIIGDAPMQGCNLEQLFLITGYDKLFEFYKNIGISIEIADLRKYHVENVYKGVYSIPKLVKGEMDGVNVNMSTKSMHADKDIYLPKYKVTDYKIAETAKFHSNNKHIYEVNKISLGADVIINVPKPKTHRLAGMTAAVKNFVGITYDKACLPHRIEGDKAHGGDAYRKKSVWKQAMHYFDEKRTNYSIDGKYIMSKSFDWLMKLCYLLSVITSGDKYRIGSWYGNDTIWRTAVDLNYIMRYSDKEGILCNKQQRQILTIGDMIICGQKEGPVGPTPKKLGMIMVSDNTLLFDRVMCEIMGFSADKLPMFNNKKALEMFGYRNRSELDDETIIYNESGVKNINKIRNFETRESWKFEPHPCWKEHIEK